MQTKKFQFPKYLIHKIRQCWLWSEVRRQALKAAYVSPGKVRCRHCQLVKKTHKKILVQVKKRIKRKIQTVTITKRKSLVHVDHIIPFAPEHGFRSLKDLGPALDRMFDLKNHQILCEKCHSKKTNEENLRRRKLNTGQV